ncbi:MAG: zinc ribbon domain-containing protein [Ignavibacteria bacterium]|nr:zinc ribbon domain-containing protein [Ignavibacteria bacterium]MBT8380796.1 zinc ribbon domain-containing protein [Ignavibacteria bacterium]MBT8392747.1 zinc ribbon domain-containing protein [Ignavibacteria bacterium]NNJ54308.1 zinc ribbon domain-containing protein [Ignavibacteriaceae bacterium]NNL22058.1 zinc ribbon domain-containing protein [Ignavibacteriaceae bacterium]
MPTYDYKCTNCNYTFEAFQPMTADPLEECPECKGTVQRLIGSGAGPIFKGSGFYQTDYKNTKPNNAKEAKPSAESKKTTKDKKAG